MCTATVTGPARKQSMALQKTAQLGMAQRCRWPTGTRPNKFTTHHEQKQLEDARPKAKDGHEDGHAKAAEPEAREPEASHQRRCGHNGGVVHNGSALRRLRRCRPAMQGTGSRQHAVSTHQIRSRPVKHARWGASPRLGPALRSTGKGTPPVLQVYHGNAPASQTRPKYRRFRVCHLHRSGMSFPGRPPRPPACVGPARALASDSRKTAPFVGKRGRPRKSHSPADAPTNTASRAGRQRLVGRGRTQKHRSRDRRSQRGGRQLGQGTQAIGVGPLGAAHRHPASRAPRGRAGGQRDTAAPERGVQELHRDDTLLRAEQRWYLFT